MSIIPPDKLDIPQKATSDNSTKSVDVCGSVEDLVLLKNHIENYISPESLDFHTKIFAALDNLQYRMVPSATRFWMLRTQRGYFYKEFISNEFVALAWNVIDSSTSLSKENIERLKTAITTKYDNVGRPMVAINKCNLFINEVKVGDYILIPSEGTRYITIALAGEYYENTDCTYENEYEIIKKIQTDSATATEITCPYKKRRKITPLITLPSNKLSYKLHRAISNYHGISNLDDYAHYILSAVYQSYSFGDKSVITLWSAQTDPIGPRALSGLLYHSTNYFCHFVDEQMLSTKVNLNSEGPIQFIIQTLQGDFPTLATLFLVISGAGIAASNCEKVPDLLKGLLSLPADLFERYVTAAHKPQELKAQDETAKQDHELKQLEIYEKKLALIEKIKASGVDPEALENDLIGIAKYSIDMKVTPAIDAPGKTTPYDASSHTSHAGNETSNAQVDKL